MHKTNIPIKVAIGYGAVAIVLVLAISLVYSNTQSILAINRASREYIQKRDAADSTMSSLLKEEQTNLKQLSDAMKGKPSPNYLKKKMDSLNNGKDSILVHPKAALTHEAKNTTVEVVKTRKGFFRRLADVFKKEHAETLSVKKDSNKAVIDSVAAPVNVAEKVADILEQIEKKDKKNSRHNTHAVDKEMTELQMVNAQLALRSAKELSDMHQKEQKSMQQAINKAIEARQHLLWQIGLLAIVATLAAIILLLYIWRDTRRERIYQENLENANKEIQRVMNQRERLLLTITHDIKAPAASISGFIDLMNDYVEDEQGKKCLSNIKHSANHLSSLVASLLDYHQLENGLMEVHPVSFLPSQLITESVEALRLQAEQKGLQISCDIQVLSQEQLYQADAFRIRQILNNLVGNAIKYTDRGSIHVQASVAQARNAYNIVEDPNAFQLVLSVKDTGKGMTTEEAQKVFQAFTRLKSAQGVEGAGLGLSITHELVTLLGGEIHLRSEVGKGSTFTVSIPLTLATEEKNAITTEAKESYKTETKDGNTNKTGGKRKGPTNNPNSDSANKKNALKLYTHQKLLILDDDKLQLQLLQEMLRRLVGDSWKIFACNHVSEALTILHNEHPALMMMDIEMPEMNGMEMIKHINHHDMTVIAMTAHDASIKEELLQAGFDDCLFKPFRTESLAELLGIELENNPSTNGNNIKGKKPTNQRFLPLLTFAEGDKEAEAEILKTVKSELEGYCQGLEKELKESGNTSNEPFYSNKKSLNMENIGKIAHKLLPIASMLQMQSVEAIKALSPEHIAELDSNTAHQYLQNCLLELREVLEEIFVP